MSKRIEYIHIARGVGILMVGTTGLVICTLIAKVMLGICSGYVTKAHLQLRA